MRIAHFGTFDVESFGDLLFPLIARRRLAGTGAELTFAAPVGGPAVWQESVPTVAAATLDEHAVDGALLGGGDIVHARPPGVDAYRGRGLSSLLAYTHLWLAPAQLARARGVPLAWNAPGVPGAMTPRSANVLRWAADAAAYLSVCDGHSEHNLRHAGVDRPVTVVPDPALDVATVWTRDELAEAHDGLLAAAGRGSVGRTLAVHLEQRYAGESAEALAARLDRIARAADATLVLLALAPCHGDGALARAVGERMRSGPVVVDRPRSLRQLVAAIAASEAYVGSSLHGLITAAAFGRPAAVVARELDGGGRFSGFLDQFQLGAWLLPGWDEAEKRLGALLGPAQVEFAHVASAAAPLLDEHWARIGTVLSETPRRTAKAKVKAPSLEGIIEEAIEAILAPAQRERARAGELSAELAAVREQLEVTRRRLGERDAIVARLSEAVELARDEREVAEEDLRDAEARLAQARRADVELDALRESMARAEAAAADREGRAVEADRLRGELAAEVGRLGGELAHERERFAAAQARIGALEARAEAAERQAGEASERAEARSAEAEALAARVREESDRRAAVSTLHEESLERERELRRRMIEERDDLEERLEATLAALNEARMPALAAPELEALEDERDRLRAELAKERAARTGLEEHVAALRAEIAAHATTPPMRSEPSLPIPPAADATPEPAPAGPPPAAALDAEANAAEEFSDRYDALCRWSGLDHLDDRERALPWPVFPPLPDGDWRPRASIVVCVHDALEDVRRCLASVARHLAPDTEVVIVDDGSDEATARFLTDVANDGGRVRLITNDSPPHGYTIAANLGLRAASGDCIVLLNSDTIVTAGWLDRVVACIDADPAIGIVGPVSNAASHQSVPAVRAEGAWATNPLPGWLTVDGMAVAVAAASVRERPRVPFVNGYCYAIKRRVLDAVGYLDEENFAEGYCEENDFSLRARAAGFTGAVADDAFVFHAKSRSYTPEGRNTHAKRNYARFLEKHGAGTVQALVDELEGNPPVAALGRRLEAILADPAAVVQAAHERLGREVAPVFVLPGVAAGGSGGSHSIVQEAAGLRALGVPARVAIAAKAEPRVRETYPDHPELFVPFGDEASLRVIAATGNVLIATHSDSVALVGAVAAEHRHVVPAYYVQDYEPFFFPEGSDSSRKAAASYSALPGGTLFAKTHWVCNIVSATHGAVVHKVEPSIDAALYRPPEAPRAPGAPVVVCAMVRPRTSRRQARSTVHLLEELVRRYGDRIAVATFGCGQAELERVTDSPALRAGHRGLLSRAEVAELLRRADLFVDHSTYQAFGRTALEAMACGCVPAVPEVGGAWEFAEPGVNALVCDTRDHLAVHRSVIELVEDGARRAALAQAGLATAARYSIERAALSEFAVFASALLAKDRVDSSEPLAARAG